jgi:putative ATPase
MPNDKQNPTFFDLPKPSKSLKSSKSVGGIDSAVENKVSKNQPLAARMRPRNLDEFVGQSHIIGPGQLLRRAIEADRIQSLIFYGPPGTGKTSLAQIIANQTKSRFERLNAAESNIADIRRLLADAKTRLETTEASTIVFVDEIHRFNKAQQDALLPQVESGVIKLIGATTENPCFYVNGPLVSRSQIFELKPLTDADLLGLLQRALKDEERGLGKLKISADEDALRHLATISDGDARKALNALELAASTTPPDSSGVIRITLTVAEQSIQKKALLYRDDDQYQVISAYQKAMRGSDPDAALYWLAKMIKAGEDPRYIARRLVICASEDVGLADSMALVVANAALQAVEAIGWPEAKLQLAHATIYVATAPKSNSATRAIEAAEHEVETGRTISVPKHLEDRHYGGVRSAGQGFDYKLPHDYPGHFVAQDYLGVDRIFYKPADEGAEKLVKERVENWRKQFQAERRQASGTCSACHHSHPFEDSFMCLNGTELAKNPTPEKPLKVKPDHRCHSFEPAHTR